MPSQSMKLDVTISKAPELGKAAPPSSLGKQAGDVQIRMRKVRRHLVFTEPVAWSLLGLRFFGETVDPVSEVVGKGSI
jgi:hypothetical protein